MMQPSTDDLDTTASTGRPRLQRVRSLARRRRTLPPRIGYAVAALVVGLGLFASVTPTFLGGLRALAAAIPHHQRAAVMSAFYVAAYASLSLPAVLAGVVVAHDALPTTFEIFGSVVAAIALTVAFEAWRTRPTRPLAA
jgi:hypothetical protein